MSFTGKNLIAGQWIGSPQDNHFKAWYPAENCYAEQQFYNADEKQLNAALEAADKAFIVYRQTNAEDKATFLHAIADEILSLGDELVSVTQRETGYSQQRLAGERLRVVNQLRYFAQELLTPTERDIIEAGDSSRQPLPKPATRLTYIPLGPVAVFGASNFPYAFSTLGGDTASALAAGCPVIVKAHPAHPGTSELMATAIEKAIKRTGMPSGVFSQLHSAEPELSHMLVKHPKIKAVGFTGSQQVADLLRQSINQRHDPIPFYGELGSTNPQFILPDFARNNGSALAEQLCQSLMMGHGQFCTSPGVWLVPESATAFIEASEHIIRQQNSDVLLTPGILKSYNASLSTLSLNNNLQKLAEGNQQKEYHANPTLFITSAQQYIDNAQLRKEIFGPCALLVTYSSIEDLHNIVAVLDGQLTACIHGSNEDFSANTSLIEALSYKTGRLIYNQMPTGVEICDSMNHGGPYPASSDVRSTSVGLKAMQRFLRPLCLQNEPII